MVAWIGWMIGILMGAGLSTLVAIDALRRLRQGLESQHEEDLEAARKGATREALRDHQDCLLRLHLTVMSNVQTMPPRIARTASPLN